jgi:imidazolonepropionase-like amidohydrolase
MTGASISAVGRRDQVHVPGPAAVLDGTGLTVTAGFWNAHVHFTDARFEPGDSRPAAELTASLRAMLTRWGVVNAVDTGSREENTLALRRRIEEGEIAGPRIMIMGGGFVPVVAIQRTQASAEAQVRAFVEAGGQLIFGTDVGYMTDYDPTDEYVLLQRAGLGFSAILATLTTAPAKRFRGGAGAGVIAGGSPADLVVLDGDPAVEIRTLARVRYTIRGGQVIYDRAQ